MRLRKAGFATGLLVSFLAVGIGAAAFACTALATLNAPTAAAPVGSNVTVTGASFSARAGTPVIIHWGGASGPEVARAVPDQSGKISTTFAVPKSQPGLQVLVATQVGADGKAVYGTPARASIAVAGPDGTAPARPAVTPQQPTSTPSSGSDGVLVLTLALGAAGLALFGAGFITTVRHGRRREQPAPAPARLD